MTIPAGTEVYNTDETPIVARGIAYSTNELKTDAFWPDYEYCFRPSWECRCANIAGCCHNYRF